MATNNKFSSYRKSLYRKLHPYAYSSLEGAISLAELRGNRLVELAHWINQFKAGEQQFDFFFIEKRFKIDSRRLDEDLARCLGRIPGSISSEARVSPFLDEIISRAWPFTSILFGESAIRSGHLLFTLLKHPDLRDSLEKLSGEFYKIDPDLLLEDFSAIVEGSLESKGAIQGGTQSPDSAQSATGTKDTSTTALGRFTVDLTDKARKGEIDPIVGRDEEIRQVIDILMRRRQNNPVLVGEAGVGKTAVVEGLAHRIVSGDVPGRFKNVALCALDIGLLQAGAGVKGEFEQRLRSVIDEVQNSPKPIILFIDEVHTLIGAGGQAGTGDAANLLKPALARGVLRTIAATTWDEYRKHIEKDPALSRRFQQVYVAEPDEAKAIRMLRVAASHLEKHHKIQLLDEAVEAAVRLSVRFMPGRQLPDKAVSLLDTAAARVVMSQDADPAKLEDCKRGIQASELELNLLQRESNIGLDHEERVRTLQESLSKERTRLAELEKRHAEEKALVTQVIELRATLRAAGESVTEIPTGTSPGAADRAARLSELKALQTKLLELQGDSPMLFPCVDQGSIAAVVSEWTGIPVGRMARRNIAEVLNLANAIERRVIGQRHALDMIAQRVQTSRARLENPDRPVAVFMFVGPSGTGKTETALALADALYGGEQNLITINMAEFQERHTVSTLKGAPPGYVGYGEGGILTEAVRRRPYSVVLLDEVEKAHPDVHKIFFQVFDKGYMEDSEGRSINFRNAVIILTSNAAQDVITGLCKDPEMKPEPDGLESALRGPLTKVFPDALLNRLTVVPYYPISTDILRQIIRLNLARVERRVRENHRLPFTFDDSVVELVALRCSELDRGARVVEALLTKSLIPAIGHEILSRALEGQTLAKVHVTADKGEFCYSFD